MRAATFLFALATAVTSVRGHRHMYGSCSLSLNNTCVLQFDNKPDFMIPCDGTDCFEEGDECRIRTRDWESANLDDMAENCHCKVFFRWSADDPFGTEDPMLLKGTFGPALFKSWQEKAEDSKYWEKWPWGAWESVFGELDYGWP